MVSISFELPAQTEARLRDVIAASDLVWELGEFSYVEYPVADFPVHEVGEAIAFVRDKEKWSVLRPATKDSDERFLLFSFHFPPGLDNSGFVGWITSAIKRDLGSGVIVVCGQNSDRGGIFDYCGVPVSMGDRVSQLIEGLRQPSALNF